MQLRFKLLMRRLADRLIEIIDGCDALVGDATTPQETRGQIDKDFLRREVLGAARLCVQLKLDDEATQLRMLRFRDLDFKELRKFAQKLLRSISKVIAVAETAKPYVDEPGNGHALATLPQKKSIKRKGGRRIETDPKEDKRIFDGWNTGSYGSKAEMAKALGGGWTSLKVKRAIDRHRQRTKRAESAADN